MKVKFLLFAAALAFAAQGGVQALPIQYQGSVPNYTTVTGTVGGFGFIDDDAPNVDFWTFTGNAGSRVSIAGNRLDSPLDLAFSLYRGVTTADTTLFIHDSSFGGLVFLGGGDDEVDVAGPFGDPLLTSFLLPATGTYTIAVGGFASDGNGPYRYSLFVGVPTPATAPLLALGLVALVVSLRRRGGSPLASRAAGRRQCR